MLDLNVRESKLSFIFNTTRDEYKLEIKAEMRYNLIPIGNKHT